MLNIIKRLPDSLEEDNGFFENYFSGEELIFGAFF
jgi:hypothetical protein